MGHGDSGRLGLAVVHIRSGGHLHIRVDQRNAFQGGNHGLGLGDFLGALGVLEVLFAHLAGPVLNVARCAHLGLLAGHMGQGVTLCGLHGLLLGDFLGALGVLEVLSALLAGPVRDVARRGAGGGFLGHGGQGVARCGRLNLLLGDFLGQIPVLEELLALLTHPVGDFARRGAGGIHGRVEAQTLVQQCLLLVSIVGHMDLVEEGPAVDGHQRLMGAVLPAVLLLLEVVRIPVEVKQARVVFAHSLFQTALEVQIAFAAEVAGDGAAVGEMQGDFAVGGRTQQLFCAVLAAVIRVHRHIGDVRGLHRVREQGHLVVSHVGGDLLAASDADPGVVVLLVIRCPVARRAALVGQRTLGAVPEQFQIQAGEVPAAQVLPYIVEQIPQFMILAVPGVAAVQLAVVDKLRAVAGDHLHIVGGAVEPLPVKSLVVLPPVILVPVGLQALDAAHLHALEEGAGGDDVNVILLGNPADGQRGCVVAHAPGADPLVVLLHGKLVAVPIPGQPGAAVVLGEMVHHGGEVARVLHVVHGQLHEGGVAVDAVEAVLLAVLAPLPVAPVAVTVEAVDRANLVDGHVQRLFHLDLEGGVHAADDAVHVVGVSGAEGADPLAVLLLGLLVAVPVPIHPNAGIILAQMLLDVPAHIAQVVVSALVLVVLFALIGVEGLATLQRHGDVLIVDVAVQPAPLNLVPVLVPAGLGVTAVVLKAADVLHRHGRKQVLRVNDADVVMSHITGKVFAIDVNPGVVVLTRRPVAHRAVLMGLRTLAALPADVQIQAGVAVAAQVLLNRVTHLLVIVIDAVLWIAAVPLVVIDKLRVIDGGHLQIVGVAVHLLPFKVPVVLPPA